jgi:transcriptional regulator with XRE-family HTH domain
MPAEPRNLAERLRWLRKERGLTQVEASTALGCDQAMVSSWEVGRTRPSAVTLGALARYYGVSLLALDTGEGFLEEAARLQTPAVGGSTEAFQVALQPASAGALMLVDANAGTQDRTDAAEAMAKLLKALKKGRQAWIVIR